MPEGEDEEFLARSVSEGRHDWKHFEVRRREIVVAARPGTNPAFDRRFLERLEAGTLSSLASELSQPELEAAAGNGGNEIRAWLMLAAAMNDAPGRTLAYSDMPEWLTGMAVAVIETDEKRSEEHTSELQSLMRHSYAGYCLKKKNNISKQLHESRLYIMLTVTEDVNYSDTI